ncbi:MAG TPA: hypothetical protein VFB83_10065 [Propionibacteriaceae bacterium]|nr:hypothetical protein [Propionibacteriaceae bacterium]
MTQPQPFLRDVIDIPEYTSSSDYVLQLVEGVADPAVTLKDYVITERLSGNFDEAMGLIKHGLDTGSSQAAYLHGSFGSGKSHFMAVLHSLLRDTGNEYARRRPEFAGLMSRYGTWLEGKQPLLVPYHMMGAKSLEQRVLGEYVTQVRKLHPDAPIPAVHRTDGLLDLARNIRAGLADDTRFISQLGGGDEDEWGESTAWTTETLDAAFKAPFDDEGRRKLVSDLLTSPWGQGFFTNARDDAEAFISLDDGLNAIAEHAKTVGYDCLILFLDELILWIANNSGNAEFVAREIPEDDQLHRGRPHCSCDPNHQFRCAST